MCPYQGCEKSPSVVLGKKSLERPRICSQSSQLYTPARSSDSKAILQRWSWASLSCSSSGVQGSQLTEDKQHCLLNKSCLLEWLLGGDWFWCRYGGFWTVSYYLMFRVVRSFLVFSGFGLKSPASGFQSYSSSSLKTSPTIQH